MAKRKAPACLIEGARTHNLKGITCTIPFGKLTAVTGVSGSGKSSLAFDVLYAEGQRRFVDCLSTYARQFLQRLDRPDVDHIGEIQPPVALKQQVSIRNARSTVGSITELSDLLHLLFAHGGIPHCPNDGAELVLQTAASASHALGELSAGVRYILVSEVQLPSRADEAKAEQASGGMAAAVALGYQEQGYARIYEAGEVRDWSPPYTPGRTRVVVDRFVPEKLKRGRALESMEAAWRLGSGTAHVFRLGQSEPVATLVEGLSCPSCGSRSRPLRPQLFSPNSPLGACPCCNGFGRIITIDRNKVVPDIGLSLRDGAVAPFETKTGSGYRRRMLLAAADAGVDLDAPFHELPAAAQEWVFTGGAGFGGVEALFARLERKRYRAYVRIMLARYRGYETCPECEGSRLHPSARSVSLGGKNLAEVEHLSVGDLQNFLQPSLFSEARLPRVRTVLDEIGERLRYLSEVGLEYLSPSRTARTLSGGETQRIRLASALGTSLTQTLYVLDEPTVGLHAADTRRMLDILRSLCSEGNTAVVVEHDPEIALGADHLIVLGPSGGELGGEVLFEGSPKAFVRKNPKFFEARADGPAIGGNTLSDEAETFVDVSEDTAIVIDDGLRLVGVDQHNLRADIIDIPMDRLVVITGVSGSGKSTLVEDVLFRNGLRHFGKPVEDLGRCQKIDGFESFEEILLVSQNPLGRSTRSTLVSYSGLLALIRKRLAATPKAKELNLRPGDFSFNVEGGRCESCKGLGTVLLEMHFMADVEVTCDVCKGKRFREDVLEVTLAGRSILQILDLTVTEALEFFAKEKDAQRRLEPLRRVGLDYLRLGQNTSTLSGGEAQRLRLASLLAEGSNRERKIFLFDEPTSGLHPQDIRKLLSALRELVAMGNGVVVVEHQLDFIRESDWIIDLGPGGGDAGGRVLYSGPVDGVTGVGESATGLALATSGSSSPVASSSPQARPSSRSRARRPGHWRSDSCS